MTYSAGSPVDGPSYPSPGQNAPILLLLKWRSDWAVERCDVEWIEANAARGEVLDWADASLPANINTTRPSEAIHAAWILFVMAGTNSLFAEWQFSER